ncbi:MAG: tripartite tricarboxylate transporter substrate binding protein [Betaproteobacteria bacterium]|nr:tripartite tricarboxylate transporter substrate binding protein [Betaproteobacteria bacterium]
MPRIFIRSILLLALCAASTLAQAQSWPTKPIHFIVPFGPGSTDILARMLAPKASAALGQPIVVENRPGATGNVGSLQVARSAGDGYTLLFGASASVAVNPALYSNLGYDPLKDLAPVILVASIPNVVIVNPKLTIKSIAELIAAAKAKPGGLNYSSNGSGSSQHMAAALFESSTGVKMVHVPYKGSTEGIVAVVRGDADVMFANLPPAMPLIADNRVRPLAVTSPKRVSLFPKLPTVAESGVPGFDVSAWFAIFVPAATPQNIVQRLNKEFGAAIADPDIRGKLTQQGYIVHGGTSQELGALMRSETVKWAKVVKESGAKAD